jgi:hypothetical protein
MSSGLLRDGVAYADQWLSHQRALRAIPGIVFAIQQDAEMLLCRGYGLANIERQEPITPQHIFASPRIRSCSRQWPSWSWSNPGACALMTTPRGLATPLATTIVRILDCALQSTQRSELEYPRETFVGRFMSFWGMSDIVAFGNRLLGLNPDDDDPTHNVTELEIVDANTLRIGNTAGYGSRGEPVRYERDAIGTTTRVSIAGYTLYPPAVFEQQLAHIGSVIRAPAA